MAVRPQALKALTAADCHVAAAATVCRKLGVICVSDEQTSRHQCDVASGKERNYKTSCTALFVL
jgi:hypothetical protein